MPDEIPDLYLTAVEPRLLFHTRGKNICPLTKLSTDCINTVGIWNEDTRKLSMMQGDGELRIVRTFKDARSILHRYIDTCFSCPTEADNSEASLMLNHQLKKLTRRMITMCGIEPGEAKERPKLPPVRLIQCPGIIMRRQCASIDAHVKGSSFSWLECGLGNQQES